MQAFDPRERQQERVGLRIMNQQFGTVPISGVRVGLPAHAEAAFSSRSPGPQHPPQGARIRGITPHHTCPTYGLLFFDFVGTS
jgi:hypothetical protein